MWPKPLAGESEALRAARTDIRASYEETWQLMRVLHQDLVERLDALANEMSRRRPEQP